MGLLSKLGRVVGTAAGFAVGGPAGAAIGGSLGSAGGKAAGSLVGGGGGGGGGGGAATAAGGLLAATLTKEQLQKSIEDYNKAQEGSVTAYTGARDTTMNALTGARDISMGAHTGARDASLGYYSPFLQGGTEQFQAAGNMLRPGFQYSPSDPSYAWRFGEGMNALARQQSASGMLNSGGGQKAAMRFGQGLASTEFANDFARRNQLAQFGLNAAQGSANAQGNYAQGVAGTQDNYAQGVGYAQNNYANGIYNSLFSGARGRDPARQNKAGATWDQVGAGVDLLGSVFGGGGNPLSGLGGLITQPAGGGQTLTDAWGFQPTPTGNVDFVNTPANLGGLFGF
jgi:hypothetical protein